VRCGVSAAHQEFRKTFWHFLLCTLRAVIDLIRAVGSSWNLVRQRKDFPKAAGAMGRTLLRSRNHVGSLPGRLCGKVLRQARAYAM